MCRPLPFDNSKYLAIRTIQIKWSQVQLNVAAAPMTMASLPGLPNTIHAIE